MNNNLLRNWNCCLLTLFALITLSACGGDDGPAFLFDRNGGCMAASPVPLSQKNFNQQVVGSGWKHLSTYEINTNGNPIGQEYYEELLGISPTDYYFESATSLKGYFYADAIPARGYRTDLRQIGHLKGDQMKVLVYLGQRSTGGGTMRYVYGYSTYQRMTEKELAACQENHPINFDKGMGDE